MFRFDLWPLLQGQTRVAKLKSAYNLLMAPTLFQIFAAILNFRVNGKYCLSGKLVRDRANLGKILDLFGTKEY